MPDDVDCYVCGHINKVNNNSDEYYTKEEYETFCIVRCENCGELNAVYYVEIINYHTKKVDQDDLDQFGDVE
jgi:hypothetical protein